MPTTTSPASGRRDSSSPRLTISVVVATCNRCELLPQCLDSLLAQTRPPDQLLVVDDGSRDATPRVLATYRDRIEVLHTPNGGKARALNRALEKVRGDYLWIFDDDDLALPDALERMEALALARPDAGIVYSSCSDQIGAGAPVERPLPVVDEADVFLRNLVQNFLQQQGMLVRTACYRAVGPFDESLLRSQDFDMAQRLTRRFRAVALPGGPTFVFRHHTGDRRLAGAAFAVTDRESMWLHYDQTIVPRLVAQLEPWEYLPGRQPRTALTAGERRRALLQQQCILVRRGLWDPGLATLEAALASNPTRPLVPEEEAIWQWMLAPSYGRRIAFDELAGHGEWVDRLGRVLRGPAGSQLRRLFLHELGRLVRWHVGHGRWREAARLARLSLRLRLRRRGRR